MQGQMKRWAMVIWGALARMDRMNLGLIAAGVAFFAMLAVFPAIAAVIALWGYVADPSAIELQMKIVAQFIPDDAFAVIDAQVQSLTQAGQRTLGWTGVASILFALWSARAGVAALIRGLNAIHRAPHRPTLWRWVFAMGLTLMLIGLALTALASVVVVPLVLAFAPLGPAQSLALGWAQWAVALATVVTGVAIIYRFGPNLPPHHERWLSPGLAFAVVLWAGASLLFSKYLENFGQYNQVYGSIGAVVALLMWFYLSAYVVLLGAALNAEISRLRRLTADRA